MLQEIQMNIAELEEALISTHPEMPVLLRKIHTKLKNDPEIVTLLSEEEINTVIRGLEVQTNVSLAPASKPKAEKKSSNTAAGRLKAITGNISADDF